MTTLAKMVVKLLTDASDLKKGLDESKTHVERFTSGVGNNLKTIGKLSLLAGSAIAGGIGVALTKVGTQATAAASDFNESFGKANIVFEDAAHSVTQFAATAAVQLGISENSALAAAGSFGNLFRTIGLGSGVSADMSTDLVALAADLAAFNNIDSGQVLEKLRSGLVGETEPLRALGINLTDIAIRARAVELGLAATTKEVDQAAMTQARFALIMEQSSLAQGTFARESAGLAAMQMRLNAIWDDALQKIGRVALPLLEGGLGKLLDVIQTRVVPGLEDFLFRLEFLFAALRSGQNTFAAVEGLLQKFFPPQMARQIAIGIFNVVNGIQQFVNWIKPLVAQVGAWLGENVKLSDIITVLAMAIASTIIPALGAFISAAAPVIATFVLLIAGVALLRKAWESDFLGIRSGIETLAKYWTEKLWPALKLVWEFIEKNHLPLFKALAELLGTVIGGAVKVLAAIFENVLMPIFRAVSDWLKENVHGPLWDKFVGWLEKTTEGANGIAAAFQVVTEAIKAVTEWLQKIELPAWLTPGSPTPLEIGLWGVGKALDQLSRRGLPSFDAQLGGLPSAQPGAALAPAMAGVGGAQVGSVTFNIDGAQDPDATAHAVFRRLQELGIVPAALTR